MRHRIFLFCVLVFVTGCASSVSVRLFGQPEMNRGGNAAVVKFYQLTAQGNFRNTPLSSFWRDDEAALGSELVTAPRKLTVYPANTKTISLSIQDKTNYLGVAANLREPDRDRWRCLVPLKKMGDEVSVTIERNTLQLEFEERALPSLGLGARRR